jgi:hypothetical protein
MARDILAEVKAHRLSAGKTASLEPELADALIRECDQRNARIARLERHMRLVRIELYAEGNVSSRSGQHGRLHGLADDIGSVLDEHAEEVRR